MTTESKIVIQVGAKTLDVTNISKLTLRDKLELKKLGLDMTKHQDFGPEEELIFVHYVLKLVDPTVTQDETLDVTLIDAAKVIKHLLARSMEVDHPTSPSPTP